MNIEEQKEKLLNELKEIERDLNALGREINEQGDWVAKIENPEEEHADPLDEATLTEEVENEIALLEVLEARHTQVVKALEYLKKGSYGICEVCGVKIEEARLEANPSATTCIEHAQ